ncbi:hypothetical protein E0Z10_g4619 [Xylaria hypoxylon]|uniref:Alcohol acetyltransferase n=1 Tax=Xylaria hypoxylon TaxID=37992 RepID=A0A4Z0YY92_9PEZI|nr:hypothetical protein E0Z10_g4619 [Xylaria hypoxylon]
MTSIDNVVRPVGSQVPASYLRSQWFSLHDAIENALAAVVLGQAMLGVGIAGEDTKEPVFVHLKAIDIRRMIEWKEVVTPPTTSTTQTKVRYGSKTEEEKEKAHYEDCLLRSLEKCHEPLWEDLVGKPGWKIVVHHDPRQLRALQSHGSLGLERKGEEDVLLSFDISFCFHHAYSDGRGGYIFHGDFQRALNNAAHPPELQNHILHLPTPPVLPPAMDTLIPFTLSWTFILHTVWTEILGPLFPMRLLRLEPSEADIPWTGAPIDGSNPKTHIRTLFKIDNVVQMNGLIAQCRSHGASLTGLLHALIARSLALHVKDRSFRSTTPIALTQYANANIASSAFTPGKTIHCLITGLSSAHDLDTIQRLRGRRDERDMRVGDNTAVWAFAKDMTACLRAKTASLPRDDIIALSGLIGDWHEFFRSKFGKARDGTWELSNLGSLNAIDAGISGHENVEKEGRRWVIDRAVFTQGTAVGSAICINVAGVAEHGIHVTISWQDAIVDVDLVEKLVGDLQAWITELVEV